MSILKTDATFRFLCFEKNSRVFPCQNSISQLNPPTDSADEAYSQDLLGPAALDEEIETWKDVYGIEERFRAKLCDEDAKEWIEQYRIIHRETGMTPRKFRDMIEEQCRNSPFTNHNFLKKPFVAAGFETGILDAIAAGSPQLAEVTPCGLEQLNS